MTDPRTQPPISNPPGSPPRLTQHQVRIQMGPDKFDYIDITLKPLDLDGYRPIEIMSANHTLIIEPRVANAIRVGLLWPTPQPTKNAGKKKKKKGKSGKKGKLRKT